MSEFKERLKMEKGRKLRKRSKVKRLEVGKSLEVGKMVGKRFITSEEGWEVRKKYRSFKKGSEIWRKVQMLVKSFGTLEEKVQKVRKMVQKFGWKVLTF